MYKNEDIEPLLLQSGKSDCSKEKEPLFLRSDKSNNSLDFLQGSGLSESYREREPLLPKINRNDSSREIEPLFLRSGKSDSNKATNSKHANVPTIEVIEVVKLGKYITLPYAVAIIIGNVIGSGIFLSPAGVTTNIGSVGGSLLIWVFTGILSLLQALSYAELGTMIPKAGGDYAYLHEIFGPLAGFMTCWIHIIVIASSSCAVIARTAGLYVIQPFGLSCRTDIIAVTAVLILITLATLNCLSSLWATRIQTLFTLAKTLALIMIIIAGMVKLGQGYTNNFQNAFEGTITNPGSIALAVLDGYFAYKGWEYFMALPEEMVNPARDLPKAVVIALLTITGIYVLTNVAYFSVLSPEELIASEAVGLLFAERALGAMSSVIPVVVALSCMGTVNGDFLSNSRYLFAGGRYKQIPQVFSYINVRCYTPILAVVFLAFIDIIYSMISDLQVLQEFASFSVLIKMLMVFSAMFYYRWKEPHMKRPMKMNTVLAVITYVIMITLVVLAFYQSPIVSSISIAIFLAGMPIYGIMVWLRDRTWSNRFMGKTTIFLQQLLLIVPETHVPQSTIKTFKL